MRRLNDIGLFEFYGEEGDRLVIYRTNRGEPFREGIDILLKNGYDTFAGCFLEKGEMRELRDKLNEMLGEDG